MIPKRLARKVIYQSPWVNLYLDRVEFPNGQVIEEHHLLDFDRQAVAAVLEDEAGRILLVQVCRYTTVSTEWETPAGCVEQGESLLEAVSREVLEETGYVAKDYRQIYTYHPMNGIANQTFHIFHCSAVERKQKFDPNEISAIRWFTQGEIREMIREQVVQDGYTLTALLLWLHGV